jgi:hypothetical protein
MRQAHILQMMRCLLVVLITTLVSPAQASVVVNDRSNITLSTFIPCAGGGETIELSGPLHTVISSTVNGNKVSGFFHFQPQGISGISETTGDVYHAVGVTRQSFTASMRNGHFVLSYVNNFRIIGQGPGNNFLVHETLHITITPDGTTTVSHDNFSIDCK